MEENKVGFYAWQKIGMPIINVSEEIVDAKNFEDKWQGKTVVYKKGYWDIPEGEYLVTASLYKHDDDGNTIFAVFKKMGEWFVFHLADEQLPQLDKDFTIIDKPRIVLTKEDFFKGLKGLEKNDPS